MPHEPGQHDLELSTIILSVLFIGVLCLILYVIIRAIVRKRKDHRETVIEKSPVVVTSATHAAPGGYPVTQVPPGGYQVNTAYTAAYPANVTVQMPMPPNQPYSNHGVAPGMAPYPTHFQGPPMAGAAGTTAGYGAGAANMNPPPYDMAVASQPSIINYEKQAPYNPSYPQQ